MNDTLATPAHPSARGHGSWRGRLIFVGLAAAVGLGTACAPQDDRATDAATIVEAGTDRFHGTLVDPPLMPAPVTLRDGDGNAVRLDRLDRLRPGTATAVVFGFTNCHDVCPTTMADLAAARRSLPAATAAGVSLVFITVDPHRDTPRVLRRWLDQFDPDIVGLRGPVDRVHRAEDSLYASQSSKASSPPKRTGAPEGQSLDAGHAHPDGDPNGYVMDHTSVVYLFGPDGTTLIFTGGATPPDYAADLTSLLGS